MVARILRTETERNGWVCALESQPLPITVSWVKGANRSDQQNATIHKWFGQLGEQLGETMGEVKASCKMQFGLPIMIRDNPDWVREWQPLYQPLTHELKRKAFEFIPMTSKFRVRQMTEFMEAIQGHYRPLGYELIDPEARKYEAMAR